MDGKPIGECHCQQAPIATQAQTGRQVENISNTPSPSVFLLRLFNFCLLYLCIRPSVCIYSFILSYHIRGWLGSRVVSVLDLGAEGPGFKSQPRRCRVTVLGKLFTPIVHLFTKQRNW